MPQISQNSAKKPRGPGKQFAPGKSGNPGGRPKKTAEELDLVAACKEKSVAALAIVEGIMHGGDKDAVRLSAAQFIIERGYGRAVQHTELTGKDGKDLPATVAPAGVLIVPGIIQDPSAWTALVKSKKPE
jgi:hypothetical protein